MWNSASQLRRLVACASGKGAWLSKVGLPRPSFPMPSQKCSSLSVATLIILRCLTSYMLPCTFKETLVATKTYQNLVILVSSLLFLFFGGWNAQEPRTRFPLGLGFHYLILSACLLLLQAFKRWLPSGQQLAMLHNPSSAVRYSAILRYDSCCTPYSAIPCRGQLDVRYPPLILFCLQAKCQCDRGLYAGYTWKTKSDRGFSL